MRLVLKARTHSEPITIDVFANTPSEGELQRGDVILAINGRDLSNFTHKQAQDAISGGGGQIEFLVQRPQGTVTIKPLTPQTETRAPSFPTSPVRAPQIVIPIQKNRGPGSPTRIVPISPQKPSPVSPSAHPDTMDSAGFMPRKVTLNKFGGGTMNFGTSFGASPSSPQKAPASMGYRPVAPPAAAPVRDHQTPPINYQTQFTAPQHSPQQSPQIGVDRGVEEEEYGGIDERRRTFIQRDHNVSNALGLDEEDYPTAPVWERRKQFGKKAPSNPAVQRSRKPLPSFGRPRAADESVITFGTDYSKPLPKPVSPKHKYAPRQRPPPVNRQDDELDTGAAWSNTLRTEARQLKPWEREALETERYQAGTVDEPYRPHTQPPVAPKPKITQISTQSTVRSTSQLSPGSGPRSVSPSVPPKPSRSHARLPHQQHLSPAPHRAPDHVSGGYAPQDPGGVVHLQYNSPIGLYSADNVRDTYVGQTQGRAQAHGGQVQKPPAVPGDRDWNDSYVYKMVHSSDKTTTTSSSGRPGQAPTGETVTTSRVSHETKYPGQEPQRHVTETVRRQPVADYKFDSSIGLSDF
ncbi:proteoglycan 4-like isoform X2 [Mya arenaria]|uniref:proteoglycan 4-like isoform X2 n=1 Tax=Mya arenaria TaxID=6604 RepID=UPI0022E7474B|nr:proteoglycan 4-like isoform X2 [Mya arenaria]